MTANIKNGPIRTLASIVGVDKTGKGGITPIRLAPLATASTGPLSLTFTQVRNQRWVNPHADFETDWSADFQQTGTVMFGTVSGAYSVAAGALTFTPAAGTVNLLTVTWAPPILPYFMMSADCTFAGNGVASDIIQFGLYKDANNYASWGFDNFLGKVSFLCKIGGTAISAGSTFTQALSGFTKFGVSVTGNQLSAWGWNGKVWIGFATIDINASKTFTTDMSGWKYAVWGQTDGATSQTIANMKITPFGGIGIRDCRFVTYENGEPVIIGGNLFFTAGVAAPGDSTGRGIQMGIFSFDPLSYVVKQVGRFICQRGGVTFGGTAGKIVMDRLTASWWVFVSTYGESGAGSVIAYQQLDSCPLFGTNLLTSLTSIPSTANDPDLYWDGTNWHMVYCQTSVHPYHLTASTIPLLASATPVSLASLVNNEGCCIRVIGGTPYILVQQYSATVGWYAYTLSNVLVGQLTLTSQTGNDSSWPNIISVNTGISTKYVALTFGNDGFSFTLTGATSYGNGQLMILESQVVAGKEFSDVRNGTR